jgi:hypothetical protein
MPALQNLNIIKFSFLRGGRPKNILAEPQQSPIDSRTLPLRRELVMALTVQGQAEISLYRLRQRCDRPHAAKIKHSLSHSDCGASERPFGSDPDSS